jgi:ABC-type phosphate/phosphonate transport system permease subunit
VDALYYEEGMLTMLDIVYDPFGWMLAFGDIAYVPYLYPLSSLYLINHSPDWPNWAFVLIALLVRKKKKQKENNFCFMQGAFAYYAFRESNVERNDFKLGLLPNAKSITMVRFDGSKTEYLISGWSSLARRPNYWPDLLNATSYSLCTGFSSTIAWIYPILFLVLLSHRQHRLEEKGRLTYRNWNDFVKAVPYRYIPFLI